MKFTINKEEHYTVFVVNEHIVNSVIAPDLKSEFVLLANEGVRALILDLHQVEFIDSSGLSAILTAKRLWETNGTLVVTGVDHENVKKLIDISRLRTVLVIIPTLDEAIDYVMMEEIERELGENSEDTDSFN